MAKRLVPVETAGATIWASNDKHIAVSCGSDIFWIHRADNPQFKLFKPREGDQVWIYFARDAAKIISILPGSQAEKLEDLPPVDPIEIEDKRFRPETPKYIRDLEEE